MFCGRGDALCVTGHYSLSNLFSFTAPIEYQNYYEGDTADRNGSAGFVGGVMKRLHNKNPVIK